MTAESPGRQSLRELEGWRESWYAHLSKPIQLPEPGVVLEVASRRGSETRLVKYLQQMCLLHRENYSLANQNKHLYLVDAFRALSLAENPLALYAVARSMFELSAFLHEVQKRLVGTSLSLTEKNWQPVGERFFGLIVRARYATTNPKYRDLLLGEGVPAARLKPFNITQCVSDLAAEPEHQDAGTRYEVLCDFVHHNLGSSTTANSGSTVSDAARSSGGGMILGPGSMTVTQYEYPVRAKVDRALDDVAPGFLRDALACVQWLNNTPSSPFTPDFLEAMTGSRLGVEVLREPRGHA